MLKNPKWHRDEIILALDLYMNMDSGKMNKSHPDIIELSGLLNRLPIHDVRPDEVKFRNPSGVSMKLNNFKPYDDSYKGKGLEGGSKLDGIIFKEFEFDTDRLRKIANRIKDVSKDLRLVNELYTIKNDELDDQIEVKEGAVIYKLHKYRERDTKIIKKKKEREYLRLGKLPCEACTFDFFQKYGKLGYKYIECHHRTPLSDFSSSSKTGLNDLALVCSNCHRMLHRKVDTLSVEGLRNVLTA